MMFHTERLLLREFVAADWSAVLAYQQEPRYLRFNAWTKRTEKDVRAFVQRFLDWQQEIPRSKIQLAVTLRRTGTLIGNVGLRQSTPAAQEAEIGYEIAPTSWGCGYATEAARAMLTFGFSTGGLQRIHAYCIAENVASVRVLEKLGMRYEERLYRHERFKGRWWDVLRYSLRRQEWVYQLPAPRAE
jgi:RimJ/RimL family protein N-acetyltransferase